MKHPDGNFRDLEFIGFVDAILVLDDCKNYQENKKGETSKLKWGFLPFHLCIITILKNWFWLQLPLHKVFFFLNNMWGGGIELLTLKLLYTFDTSELCSSWHVSKSHETSEPGLEMTRITVRLQTTTTTQA